MVARSGASRGLGKQGGASQPFLGRASASLGGALGADLRVSQKEASDAKGDDETLLACQIKLPAAAAAWRWDRVESLQQVRLG